MYLFDISTRNLLGYTNLGKLNPPGSQIFTLFGVWRVPPTPPTSSTLFLSVLFRAPE
jgi:hypothetical protein